MTHRMPIELRSRLEKQGYHLLGERGAFKACQWQHKSLTENKVCYKQRFYGIESHRCLQMTPVVDKCTQQCRFCWRVTPGDIGVRWNQLTVSREEVLGPSELLDATLMANLRSLGGYNPDIRPEVSRKKYEEARDPRHVAISLAGEPTLYPMLSEFIEEVHRRDMTSFLVTNGTRPDVLKELTPPTQLYITLAAPTDKIYTRLCHPMQRGQWEKLMESEEMLQSISCRTANRLTMVQGYNMEQARQYAKIILTGEPDFIEVKGYMHIGSSRARLSPANSPAHREVRGFAEKIAALTGYFLQDEQVESRVVLLTRDKHWKKIR